jgi:hypothetical protein
MTKEEKIKEAYGEYWNLVKDLVRNDGSLSEAVWLGSSINLPYHDYSTGYYRPDTLWGITDNNGWIKFEGNPPKESNWYWIKTKNDTLVAYWANHKNIFVDNDSSFYFNAVTHYQPVRKPKPPLY